MVFRVKGVTEGVWSLNPPRRGVLVQSPVIKEMGPLILAIILIPEVSKWRGHLLSESIRHDFDICKKVTCDSCSDITTPI